MYFAAQVLLASAGKPRLRDFNADQRILRFIAIATTTAICLMLYISSTKSRLVNRLTAVAKILLLLVICGFGFAHLSKMKETGTPFHDDWADDCPLIVTLTGLEESDSMKPKWPLAFLTILFTFHGWENATLVQHELSAALLSTIILTNCRLPAKFHLSRFSEEALYGRWASWADFTSS